MNPVIARSQDVMTIVTLPATFQGLLEAQTEELQQKIIDEIQKMAQIQALLLNSVLLSPSLSPFFCRLLKLITELLGAELSDPTPEPQAGGEIE